MPSNELRVITLCAYLTNVEKGWRTIDHHASMMVKALKGDEFNGFFKVKIGGQLRRFNKNNASDFVNEVAPAMAHVLKRKIIPPAATLVPIPNSHVTRSIDDDFKTFELATDIAAKMGNGFKAVPALVFDRPQQKSRQGGSRDPRHFESAYKLVRRVSGPIILIDDVCTSGAHFIGAAWKLASFQCEILFACAWGRTTDEQTENPVAEHEHVVSLKR
jgi:hypothetical protein